MKTIYITLTLFLLVNIAHGQSEDPDPLAPNTYLDRIKEINLCGTYERFQFTSAPVYNSFGISIEGVFRKQFGFEVGISGGKNNFQTGLGVLLLPLYIKANRSYKEDSSDGFKWINRALLAILFLEHVNYHIKLSQNFQLIPYLSPLRIRYMQDTEKNPIYDNTYVFLAGSAGMKAGLIIKDRWLLNAYCEWGQLYYKGNPSGIQAGLNLGILLPWQD